MKKFLIVIGGTVVSFATALGSGLVAINRLCKKFKVTYENIDKVWKTWNNVTKCKYVISTLRCLAAFYAGLQCGLKITEYFTSKIDL